MEGWVAGHTSIQLAATRPLVSPELAFQAHQKTCGMALCAPSLPMPVFMR